MTHRCLILVHDKHLFLKTFNIVCTLRMLLVTNIDCFAVCVMYIKQFASEEWREASFSFKFYVSNSPVTLVLYKCALIA